MLRRRNKFARIFNFAEALKTALYKVADDSKYAASVQRIVYWCHMFKGKTIQNIDSYRDRTGRTYNPRYDSLPSFVG